MNTAQGVLMPKSTASCKAKGRRLQQEVAKLILTTFSELAEEDVRSTSMGSSGVDIQLSPAARKLFPYSVECKNTEKLNVWSALKQCESNCPDGSAPLLVFRRNRSKTYAVVELEHFMDIVAASK
jgi:hypothetical protein